MEQVIEETNKEKVWVPLSELEVYLKGLSAALMNMVGNIETTINIMHKNKSENDEVIEEDLEGDTNDDN